VIAKGYFGSTVRLGCDNARSKEMRHKKWIG
jgi:hypothetical protein